jgi:hypothetical protein
LGCFEVELPTANELIKLVFEPIHQKSEGVYAGGKAQNRKWPSERTAVLSSVDSCGMRGFGW